MKVNDPNLQGVAGPGGGSAPTRPAQTTRTAAPAGSSGAPGATEVSADGDGVQLSGLAQSLRGLDSESPERAAQVEALARAYSQGSYRVDAEKTAAGIIDDVLKHQ